MKILKEMGIPDHLTCLLKNLYAGQEATVRTGHETTDWFQIGKGVHQGCILSPCLCNHDGVITYLEPDNWECEVKWALGGITKNKASGGDGFPVEPFQILKDDAVKVLHSICQLIWKTQQWPQDWKRSVFIPIPKKGNPKSAQITTQLHSSYMLVKSCSKFSKPSFSNTWTMNLQMFKLVLEKAEEPEIKLPISAGSSKKQESSRKHLFLLYWLCQSLWLCGSQ